MGIFLSNKWIIMGYRVRGGKGYYIHNNIYNFYVFIQTEHRRPVITCDYLCVAKEEKKAQAAAVESITTRSSKNPQRSSSRTRRIKYRVNHQLLNY